MTLPIPAIALRQHTAVLGKTRVGKTSTVKLIIENAVAEGERVCILDTEKSDYWGLTSSASGKRGALPFRILGGPRGHVPLRADSGKIVGELVATGKLPLSIIDMAHFEMGDHQHFFSDFAKTLHRNTRGVLRLVIEEAHNIAPKERIGVGHESLAVYWAKKLATGGGMKGIRLVVVTQRTQALHNALLGSCDTMIAHRTILEADQKPIREWLNNVTRDKDIREEVSDSLGSLAVGEAWVCSGEASSFQRVTFPRIKTYDNTASPDSDAEAQDVATAPIDRDELHAILGQAAEQAEAADPKQIPKLKSQIERLTAQLANAAPVEIDPQQIEDAKRQGYSIGAADTRRQYENAIAILMQQWEDAAPKIERLRTELEVLRHFAPDDVLKSFIPEITTRAPKLIPREAALIARARAQLGNGSAGTKVSPTVRKVLDAIHRAHPMALSFEAAAMRAAVSKRSSAYEKYRAEVEVSPEVRLRTDGRFVSAPGHHAPIDPGRDPVEEFASKLPPSFAAMLRAIAKAHGRELDRETIAAQAGVSPTSSGLSAGLREIEALGLIVGRDKGKFFKLHPDII